MLSNTLPAGWYWFCDQCGTALKLKPRGKMLCRGCRFPIIIRARQGALPDVDGASASTFPTVPIPDANCGEHPEQAALGLCERCGGTLCAPCVRIVQGRLYCAGCVPFLGRRFAKRVFKHQRYSWVVIVGFCALYVVAIVLSMLVR